ncbi:MAG: endolytic transglycosylase MltG [Christensenellales bacterium]
MEYPDHHNKEEQQEGIVVHVPRKSTAGTKKQRRRSLLIRYSMIIGVSLLVVIGGAVIAAQQAYHNYFDPVDVSNTSYMEVVIPNGSSVSKIGRILEDSGVIRNRTSFKILVDLQEMGTKLRSGTYYLSKSMSMDTILDILSSGTGLERTISVTVVEGRSVEQIAEQLVETGLLPNTATFLKLCNQPEQFSEYPFLNHGEEEAAGRRYALEGYLFPDTYEFYSDASETTIIRKLLARFAQMYGDTLQTETQEMDMTMDQVVTLASMIEQEAKGEDFSKVSAVFHNRLAQGMRLESCATVQYIMGVNKLVLTDEDMAIESPYNTYDQAGLPKGPICNPGLAAIQAALNPDETLRQENYLFFCLMDPEEGSLAFSKTLDEHNALKAIWQPLWLEHDKKYAK